MVITIFPAPRTVPGMYNAQNKQINKILPLNKRNQNTKSEKFRVERVFDRILDLESHTTL